MIEIVTLDLRRKKPIFELSGEKTAEIQHPIINDEYDKYMHEVNGYPYDMHTDYVSVTSCSQFNIERKEQYWKVDNYDFWVMEGKPKTEIRASAIRIITTSDIDDGKVHSDNSEWVVLGTWEDLKEYFIKKGAKEHE